MTFYGLLALTVICATLLLGVGMFLIHDYSTRD
jgi:hypothetical protein